MSSELPFLVVNRESEAVVYRGNSLQQVRGFIDGQSQLDTGRSQVAVEVELQRSMALTYRLVVIDDSTGQILMCGPELRLFDIEEAVINARITILPTSIATSLAGWYRRPEPLPDDAGDDWDDDDEEGEEWWEVRT